MSLGVQNRDIGSVLDVGEQALVPAVITAGAGNDNVEVNGPEVNRLRTGRKLCLSARLVIFGQAVLANTETLTLTFNAQDDTTTGMATAVADFDAKSGGYYSDAGAGAGIGTAVTLSSGNFPATVVATGTSGGSTEEFVAWLDFDLSDARQFIRGQVTANLSASGTDTVALSGFWILGGADELPASAKATGVTY